MVVGWLQLGSDWYYMNRQRCHADRLAEIGGTVVLSEYDGPVRWQQAGQPLVEVNII